MSFEDIFVRFLNRSVRTRPSGRTGLYVGQAEPILGGEQTAFALPVLPIQHLFASGRTGTGKTTLFARIMYERIRRGLPLINIDFHGPATTELLAMLGAHGEGPPGVLFKPGSHAADPVIGWNPLHADRESIPAVVQELISIFHLRLWPAAWGPKLEELLRETLVALSEAGLTLVEVAPFLSRPDFRRAVLQRVTFPGVREFWRDRFDRLSPAQRANAIETVLTKVAIFNEPIFRQIVGQRESALDFDRVLAENQTVLADLSAAALRGHRYLLAALLVAKFKNAVLRRPPPPAPHAIFLDEFHEVLPDEDLDDFLRTFRKFGVSVFLATQQLALSPELRSAVFTNCSHFCSFATSAADAAALGREFGSADGELAADLLPELHTGEAVVKVRGEPVQLLRVSPAPARATPDLVAAGRKRCLELGKSRETVDAEIARRTRDFFTAPPRTRPQARRQDSDDDTRAPEGYE